MSIADQWNFGALWQSPFYPPISLLKCNIGLHKNRVAFETNYVHPCEWSL